MIDVAKEEMRTAGHAPAAATTLFDGCTVAVVKVASVHVCMLRELCSAHSCCGSSENVSAVAKPLDSVDCLLKTHVCVDTNNDWRLRTEFLASSSAYPPLSEAACASRTGAR